MNPPINPNYCATIVQIDKLVTLPNCDNVQAAIIFGNSVIVGKETKIGDIGVFFPAETALSPNFLKCNNLYRDPSLNYDNTKKGYFEAHGRIKTMKFRGHKSEGIYLPLDCFKYLSTYYGENFWFSLFEIGQTFDHLGDEKICEKYVPHRQSSTNPDKSKRKPTRKLKLEDTLVENQFRLHVDTYHLGKNIHKIEPNHIISISEKLHGTSAVIAHLPVKCNEWYDKYLRMIGIHRTEYAKVWSSRKVLKGVGNSEKQFSNHYYKEDVWGVVASEVFPSIPKGFTLYGEIVGYTPSGGMIQKGYHYGCKPVEHKFFVYRITNTNPDGFVTELGWPQMQDFCSKYGLEMVPTIYYGKASDFIQFGDKFEADFLETISALIENKMCPLNNKEVPAEGVVVRVERFNDCEVYKAKSFLFREWESKALDAGEGDFEEVEENNAS